MIDIVEETEIVVQKFENAVYEALDTMQDIIENEQEEIHLVIINSLEEEIETLEEQVGGFKDEEDERHLQNYFNRLENYFYSNTKKGESK